MPAETAIPAATQIALYITTGLVCLAGALLLWHWELGPVARKTPQYSRVRPISASWFYFAAMCIFVIFAAFFVQILFAQCWQWFLPDAPMNTGYFQMLAQGVFNIGAIAAMLYARRFLLTIERLPRIAVIAHAQPKPAPPISPAKAVLAGIGVFCIARAAFVPVAFLWDLFLKFVRIDAPEQNLIGLFRDEPSVMRVVMMTLIAVVVVPIAEEMAFRGGLFGYIRTRTQRLIALIIPSFVFALVHGNLRTFPLLFLFAVILSIAYERTGRLSVPIIAHALLNLSTIALILLGLAT